MDIGYQCHLPFRRSSMVSLGARLGASTSKGPSPGVLWVEITKSRYVKFELAVDVGKPLNDSV